ncbi:MAG: deoxyguanosinetriphosphate triphosphohydrolase [Desulfobacterota bacterium]|nr:deoxyguanosinetriphosphate triphosphohydrolase [Thermodesulfobacteriota bacterium]
MKKQYAPTRTQTPCIREQLEAIEQQTLHPRAQLSSASRGRLRPEQECDLRPAFQHDRDRIIHSKAFRRLKHKTQVFLTPSGDHYRTRLTHTLEVAQIARTIAKSLLLNEDLTEAIALGHDLGHTPFGHAGEEVLNSIVPGGFRHPEQSLRVVDVIEDLNLTHEVRDGILKHTKRGGPILPDDTTLLPQTLEGQIVRIADSIAYLNHDLDDALRACVITPQQLRADGKEFLQILGATHSERIGTMVRDVIVTTLQHDRDRIRASRDVLDAAMQLRRFLDDRVYTVPAVYDDFKKASRIITELYHYYLEHPDMFYRDSGGNFSSGEPQVDVCDFISGMTDRYAFSAYEKIFLPRPWLIF